MFVEEYSDKISWVTTGCFNIWCIVKWVDKIDKIAF